MNKSTKQPILFMGHGSPMNAIEENRFSLVWKRLGEHLEQHFEQPKGIIAISAHWYTATTRTNNQETPQQIYDMYGFPKALYQLNYPARGSHTLAEALSATLAQPPAACSVLVDNSWGIDHGTWSVLTHLCPRAEVPVVQLSIDFNRSFSEHFELGYQLAHLSKLGYLILGSGNVVHHLGRIQWDMDGGFDWAITFDNAICKAILARDYDALIQLERYGEAARNAVPTPDHYLPLLYILGAVKALEAQDGKMLSCDVINRECLMGSLSMTSYVFGTAYNTDERGLI